MNLSERTYGWIPPDQRTKEQNELHEKVMAELITPFTSVRSKPINVGDRYPLWKVFEGRSGGVAPYINQTTGSCVGAGGYNALMTLQMVEIITGQEAEKFELLWWPYTYGVSRRLGGMTRKGEGSFGSSWFKAIKEFGMPKLSAPGLPGYQERGSWLFLDRSTELNWSYSPKLEDQYDEYALEHPIEGGFEITSIEQLDAALTNGYACTVASSEWGTRSSRNVDGWAVANWDDRWAHQQFIDEVCYPSSKTGKLYRIGNNWGPDAHPSPTQGEPAGGYYVTEKHMDKIVRGRHAETFALAKFKGIPTERQDIWDIILSMVLEDVFSEPNNEEEQEAVQHDAETETPEREEEV